MSSALLRRAALRMRREETPFLADLADVMDLASDWPGDLLVPVRYAKLVTIAEAFLADPGPVPDLPGGDAA